MADETLHEYALDIKLACAIRVHATSFEEAVKKLNSNVDSNTANLGAWENGDEILAEVSVHSIDNLYEIDGEDHYGLPTADVIRAGAGEWDFTLSLNVYDPAQLYTAALHQQADFDADTLAPDGKVDVEACLTGLLDPGKLPGCSVHSSCAVRPEGTEEEEDDE